MKDFDLSCRIFIGNLASEKTSKEELEEVFSKYGRIVEIVLRKSFGFIQFDNPQAAQDAIAHENGKTLGGLRVGKSSSPSLSLSLPRFPSFIMKHHLILC